MFAIIPRVEIIELIALAGFEGVIIDFEHGPIGMNNIVELVVAARAREIYSIVRVRENNATLIGASLDAGADGVLVPQVRSREESEAAVSAARFAPFGSRGANPWVRAAAFGSKKDWFHSANEGVAIIAMIEGNRGVAAAADIVETPGLDGVFLGPVDLSHALGLAGNIEHPDVTRKISEVVELGNSLSKTIGVFAPKSEGARHWISLGARMVAVGVDTGHILNAFTRVNRETLEVRAEAR